MKRGHQHPSLNPSPLPFYFSLVMILYHIVIMYQFHLAHFAIEALNELGIVRWFFINMHITLGVPFFIFLVHQNDCLNVVGKRFT